MPKLSTSSPIAALTRFEVKGTGGLGVSGIISSQITLDAEGDAATLVPGSFQEVGPGEYWGVLLPPTKSAGTSFVNLEVCLQGTICDTELDALLYADPGNTDVAYVVDESGSMSTEDTPGEGARDLNVRKALEVLKNLLREDDRVLLIGFGAENNPLDCGLPPDGSGDGNCPSANILRLPRTDVTLPGTLGAVQAAINATGHRPLWTNIGQALIDAKDGLLANPGNTTPDHIYLLSDGMENVNPLYATPLVRDVLQAAGVHVSTIKFGPEADGALMAQIAAENSGNYRPVATSGLGLGTSSVDEARASLHALGVPEPMADVLVSSVPFLPGQLRLAEVYDDFDTSSQDAARVLHSAWTNVTDNMWQETSAQVDKSASLLRFVVAGKQYDADGSCEGYHRKVEVLIPGAGQREWIPISPADPKLPPPPSWDIRNSPYSDVLIVPNPQPGTWRFRTKYYYMICAQGQSVSPQALESDFIMNASLQSTIHLEGRILGLDHLQGAAGDTVPIVATLLTKGGTIPGALVGVAIENEGGTDYLILRDDGAHNDGAANDGIYGWPYSLTTHGGSYAVRMLARFADPANPGVFLFREWNGGFWIKGPKEDGNPDDDGMPSWWEKRYPCLDPRRYDGQEDADQDGLVNYGEFLNGTNPCRPDTDRGGEQDGSEVNSKRNPLWPDDDLVVPLPRITLRALDQRVWIKWGRASTFDNLRVWVSTRKGQLGQPIDMGRQGEYILGRLENGRPYYLTFQAQDQDAWGTYSDQHEIVPREDALPPEGGFYIRGPSVTHGGDRTSSRDVILYVEASDSETNPGPTSGAAGSSEVGPDWLQYVVPSGNVQMRFSNDWSAIDAVAWEPLADEKPWRLDCEIGKTCHVFGQFRDGAGNESTVIVRQILYSGGKLYLPIVLKGH